MKTIADMLKEHPFFAELTSDKIALISSCAKNVHFRAGEKLAEAGDDAGIFFLLRSGDVALSMQGAKGPFLFQTLHAHDIVGTSWLIPPYHWTCSATAQTPTAALAFDGTCLRGKCEKDHNLGYTLMKHLLSIMVKREESLKLHILDIYGR